ncbi:MAG: hypothetical protein HYU36_03140 [Planctomycetes bacterium]|nr:hypothetical protein [Planctomycetota bacterium]
MSTRCRRLWSLWAVLPSLGILVILAAPTEAEIPKPGGAGGAGGAGRKPNVKVAPGQADTSETEGESSEPSTPDSFILDRKGNGVDLGGSTVTSLLTGKAAKYYWVQKDSDDFFLVMDTTSLRQLGYDVRKTDGNEIKGKVLVRGGILIKTPDGASQDASDAWAALTILDMNEDGKLNSLDKTWTHLRAYSESKKDGTMDGQELHGLSEWGVKEIELPGEAGGLGATTDEHGNTLVRGAFLRADGKKSMAFAVTLALVPAGSSETTTATQPTATKPPASTQTAKPPTTSTKPSSAPKGGSKGGGGHR